MRNVHTGNSLRARYCWMRSQQRGHHTWNGGEKEKSFAWLKYINRRYLVAFEIRSYVIFVFDIRHSLHEGENPIDDGIEPHVKIIQIKLSVMRNAICSINGIFLNVKKIEFKLLLFRVRWPSNMANFVLFFFSRIISARNTEQKKAKKKYVQTEKNPFMLFHLCYKVFWMFFFVLVASERVSEWASERVKECAPARFIRIKMTDKKIIIK